MKKILKYINIVHFLKLDRYTKQAILLASVGIFIAVHMLLSFVTLRLDLSKGSAYTLSSSTKQIVQQIKTPVTITLYSSSHMPPRITPVQRDVIDLLREYDRAGSNVVFQETTFDPAEDTKIVQDLAQVGITGIPVKQTEQNEVSLTKVYFGVVLDMQGKKQSIADPFDIESLEYNITAALYALTRAKKPTIGILGLTASLNPQLDQIGVFKKIAGSQFLIQDIPLQVSEDEPFIIPKDIDTLFVIDTAENTFEPEIIDAIRAYLKTGSAIVFLNGVAVDDSLQTAPGEENLIRLIKGYGIEVERNLVLSSRAEFVNFGSGGFSLFAPYPYWVWSPNVNTDTNYVGGISRITFPWVSSLTLADNKTVRYLVQSSPQSWAVSGTINLNPQTVAKPNQEDKQYILAAESDTSESGSLAVIGSSRFLLNNYLSRQSQNIEYILNILSNYASDGALSGIRSRAVTIYPLPPFTQNGEQVYKYLVILLLPGLFGVYGAVRLWKRNKTS